MSLDPQSPIGGTGPAGSIRSRWGTGAVIAVISAALALGAAELVLRGFLPVRGMIYELDDRYLYRHVPGSRKLAIAGEHSQKVLVEINPMGRRGDESALPLARHRVVVYGDSFIAAESTAQEETYAAQLERLLTEHYGLTKVLNAGVTGYGIDQESLRIEDELPALRPEVVIVAAYAGNDFGDLLRNKLYRLDAAGALVKNVPVVDEALKAQFQAPRDLSDVQLIRLVQVAFENRPTPQPVPADRSAAMLANRTAEYEGVIRGDNVVRDLLADEYDADVSLTPDSESARYRVRLMESLVARLATTIADHHASFIFLIIPEWCDLVETCDVSDSRRQYPGYRPSGATDALEGIARRRAIRSLNLYDAFRRQGGAGLYHRFNQHWNTAGQKLAARLTTDLIIGADLLKPAPQR